MNQGDGIALSPADGILAVSLARRGVVEVATLAAVDIFDCPSDPHSLSAAQSICLDSLS